jgi:hypothetical protein
MKVRITFSIANPHFDQAQADLLHDGEDTPENKRYNWVSGYTIDNVSRVEEEIDTEFLMKGKYVKSGEPFSFEIPGMRTYRFISPLREDMVFAVSESLLRHDAALGQDGVRQYEIRFNEGIAPHYDFAIVAEGIFIAKNDIPKALLDQ